MTQLKKITFNHIDNYNKIVDYLKSVFFTKIKLEYKRKGKCCLYWEIITVNSYSPFSFLEHIILSFFLM